MQIGKGDIRSQRQRRRDRYRGCPICGLHGTRCIECSLGEQLVAIHGYASLALVVDGSFVPAGKDARNAPRVHRERYAKLKDQIANEHPDWTPDHVEAALIEALTLQIVRSSPDDTAHDQIRDARGVVRSSPDDTAHDQIRDARGVVRSSPDDTAHDQLREARRELATGAPPHDELGHGGAGLVLVRGDEILASRACGFRASSSSEAELHAVIRASRWAPGVAIYTDACELPIKMARINPNLSVYYLDLNQRADAYVLAHRLSVEGRCREAPETMPTGGLAFVTGRPQRSRTERQRMGAELLLEHARFDPSFDGDFTALAARLGWTSGRWWQDNPAIRIATARWQVDKETPG